MENPSCDDEIFIKGKVIVFKPASDTLVKFQPKKIELCEENCEIIIKRDDEGVESTKLDNLSFFCGALSGNHARLFLNDSKFYLQDLGSTNGTFLLAS